MSAYILFWDTIYTQSRGDPGRPSRVSRTACGPLATQSRPSQTRSRLGQQRRRSQSGKLPTTSQHSIFFLLRGWARSRPKHAPTKPDPEGQKKLIWKPVRAKVLRFSGAHTGQEHVHQAA